MFVCLFVCLLSSFAQECGFIPPENYQTYDNFNEQRLSSIATGVSERYCINVCFRIVRDDNGTNPSLNPNQIPQLLADMNSKYNPHGIYFTQMGTFDYINSTNYNNYLPGSSPANLPNCLNIYFINNLNIISPNVGGIASFGTLRATIKGSNSKLSGTVNHEVGHALNLKHTFTCTDIQLLTCTENPFDTNVNTNGCETKGDQICDTPADYNNFVFNNTNPPYYPISSYNADKNNIMSYWQTYNSFTTGQGIRMKNAIIGASVLQSIKSYKCAEIVGSSRVCRGQNNTFSVNGVAFGSPTYNWSVSGNLQIIGSNTGATVNLTRLTTNYVGSILGIISVIINGSITITKTIRSRCGFYGKPVGVYDWISKDYGNMGLVLPIEQDEDEPLMTYLWEIKENESTINQCNNGIKPFFIGASVESPNVFKSTTKQAVINWGNCSNSYLMLCYGVDETTGEKFLISSNYVDVGEPKNNPCFKNNFQTIIAPNPVRDGIINIRVNKPEENSPCNYKNSNEPQFFNSELDKINNSITIFDYNGNQVYSNVFESNEFTISEANLQSSNNYVVNLYTNEGGFTQRVIIIE